MLRAQKFGIEQAGPLNHSRLEHQAQPWPKS